MDRRVRNPRRRSLCRKRASAFRRCRVEKTTQRKRTVENVERNIKKSSGILCEAPGRRVKFAKKELSKYKTSEVCRLLGVSRREYYRISKEQDNEEKELGKEEVLYYEKLSLDTVTGDVTVIKV